MSVGALLSDALDARALARYAQERHPRLPRWQAPDPQRERLQTLVLTRAALIALMPELGHIDRRQAAALAGVAPHPNQSGAVDAYRRTRGGRPEVKRTLFLAAMAASRHHPGLKEAYQRLCMAGKKPILALTALMRRLIVIANACLRDAFAENRMANRQLS